MKMFKHFVDIYLIAKIAYNSGSYGKIISRMLLPRREENTNPNIYCISKSLEIQCDK